MKKIRSISFILLLIIQSSSCIYFKLAKVTNDIPKEREKTTIGRVTTSDRHSKIVYKANRDRDYYINSGLFYLFPGGSKFIVTYDSLFLKHIEDINIAQPVFLDNKKTKISTAKITHVKKNSRRYDRVRYDEIDYEYYAPYAYYDSFRYRKTTPFGYIERYSGQCFFRANTIDTVNIKTGNLYEVTFWGNYPGRSIIHLNKQLKDTAALPYYSATLFNKKENKKIRKKISTKNTK